MKYRFGCSGPKRERKDSPMKTLTASILVLIPAVAFAAGGGYTPKHSPAKVEKIPGQMENSA